MLLCLPFMNFKDRKSENALYVLTKHLETAISLISVNFIRFAARGQEKLCKMLGVDFQVEGLENFLKNEPSIYILNHQSMIDAAS